MQQTNTAADIQRSGGLRGPEMIAQNAREDVGLRLEKEVVAQPGKSDRGLHLVGIAPSAAVEHVGHADRRAVAKLGARSGPGNVGLLAIIRSAGFPPASNPSASATM